MDLKPNWLVLSVEIYEDKSDFYFQWDVCVCLYSRQLCMGALFSVLRLPLVVLCHLGFLCVFVSE